MEQRLCTQHTLEERRAHCLPTTSQPAKKNNFTVDESTPRSRSEMYSCHALLSFAIMSNSFRYARPDRFNHDVLVRLGQSHRTRQTQGLPV